ncbi:DUF5060 domain-containing protein [Bacteroides sedimenti]|uniref:DUF5060 domain-containing protein n=1 Tax=Bacteroides sedimenti TaxID=2136147 RepID=A0ABM8ICW6_9BACE
MKKNIASFFVLFLITQIASANFNKVTVIMGKFALYEKVEINVNLTENWQNPYLQEDIALDMEIISPSGRMMLLPCFYVSGESGKESLWKARFTPQELGKYQYKFVITKNKHLAYSTGYKKIAIISSGSKNGFLHANDKWTFRFDDGKPFRGIGENICWESRDSDDSKFFKELNQKSKFNYEYMLPTLATNGGNFFRTWMCSWNLPIDFKNGFNNNRYQSSDEYYNPSALIKMDRLMELNDSLHLYMMLTLGPGAYNKREGGLVDSAADFFVKQEAKQRYKNRLRYIVARWGYSTSIAAWEFFNEVDNVQFGDPGHAINGADIVAWHDEMSRYLKSIDPYNHICTTSISHRDIDGLNSLKCIDVNQKHIYRNTSIIPVEINRYVEKFDKPYVIGEFGYEWDWSKNFNDFAESMDMDFRRGLWYGLFSPTPILPMSWWWEFFDSRNMQSYLKGVRQISDMMLAAGDGSFQHVPVNAGNCQAFGVKCGSTFFVYLLNANLDPASVIVNIQTKIDGNYSIQSFDPKTLIYKDVKVHSSSENGLKINDLYLESLREQVIIITPSKK